MLFLEDLDLLKCNHLLLWDCMNQSCNLSDHIWRHVSDSASILHFHLLRPHAAYTNEHWSTNPMSTNQQSTRLTYRQWFRQRIQVLLGIDILNGLAAGMVKVFKEMEKQTIDQETEFRVGMIKRRRRSMSPLWGEWKPGSSDTVGRHGPEWMTDTEAGEVIVIESSQR